MAHISTQDINDIRANANIVDIIREYIPLTQKGKNFVGVCPFHDDHSPSLSVSFEKQLYKCFSCGAGGNVFTFVQNYENVSFAEAVSLVATKIGRTLNTSSMVFQPASIHKIEHEIMDFALKFYQNNLKTSFGIEAKKYLTNRGISEETIKDFGIGLALDRTDALYTLLTKKAYDVKKITDLGLIGISKSDIYDLFSKRIMFPLWDKDGVVVGFSGRVYRGEKDVAKYMNSKETILFKKGETLYNYHQAKEHAKQEKAMIVVEGFMDAIRLWTNGIKNVVALQGTAMTKDQIYLLKKLRCKIILCLDNDQAGELATITNGNLLVNEHIELGIIRLTGEKDPDEYILKEGIDSFKENLKNPINYFDFKMNYLKQNRNLSNAEDLSAYVHEVIKSLSNSDDEILKDITLKKLSKEYDLSYDLLKERLNEEKPVEIIKKEEPIKAKKNSTKKDCYTSSSEKILFFMMNDAVYIKMYIKKLGFFENPLHRKIANEIMYYYEKYKTINLADFITFISTNELHEEVMKIVSSSLEDELSQETMDDYLKVTNKLMINAKIKELKAKMRVELDADKKLKLAQKIAELKKGCVE